MSKIFCMSDIHGCHNEFKQALDLIRERLSSENVRLVLLGDYIHVGPESHAVLDEIMSLQKRFGTDKIICLAGNHERLVTEEKLCGIASDREPYGKAEDQKYLSWLKKLPNYYTDGNTIFVHAGIEEDAEDEWELSTPDYYFTGKYPPSTGRFATGQKIVAGHVSTATISGDPGFHDIYYDGESHYYIDGDVFNSHTIPVLMVDTDTDQYYAVRRTGITLIKAYQEKN